MSDEPYWGASAYWSRSGQYDFARYTDGAHFSWATLPADHPNNHDTIWDVWDRIMSAHPENISVLADQWVNMANLLQSVRNQLSQLANTLAAESWRSSDARQEFLRLGPGQALAYLDQWIDAAWRNIDVLRAAVGLTRRARSDMERLVRDYNAAVENARTLNPTGFDGFIRQVGAVDFSDSWKWFTGWGGHSQWEQLRDDWHEARDTLRAEAVRDVETEYTRAARDLASRYADEYMATVSGAERGFGPKFEPMDTVLNKPAFDHMSLGPLPSMPMVNLPGAMPGTPQDPGEPLPYPGGSQPGAPAMPGVPGVGGMPGFPPVVAPLPGVLGGPPNQVVPSGRTAMPGLPGQSGMPPMLPPGTPRGGVLRRPGDRAQDPSVHGPAPTEETFSVPPGNTAPPIVRNPRRTTPGRKGVPAVPGVGQEEFPTAPVGASPPVVGAPSRGLPPVRPTRERERVAAPQPAGGDVDHLGLDELRAGAAHPVVDAPVPVAGGSIDASPAVRAGRPAAVDAGELAARRTAQRSDAAPDEAAFVVDTPGGAVVAKPREETDVRTEPPAALSGPGVASGGV